MSQHLSHKKSLRKNSEGFAGIIATVFLVLIVLFLSANVFMFIQNQNTRLESGARQASQFDIDQKSEQISISELIYLVAGDTVSVQAQVTNDGPVEIEIVTIWVIDTTNQRYAYNDTLNLYLNVGETVNLTGTEAPQVIIENSASSEFTSWFITSRGNRLSIDEESTNIVVANIAQGIGSLALDFDKFKWYTFTSSTKLANYPSGNTGFDIPAGQYIAYSCVLKNYDALKRSITIDCHSLLFQAGRSGVGEGTWFIVNVGADGTILSQSVGSFTNITINYGEEKTLIFASSRDLGIGAFVYLKTDNAVATVSTNLLLHGTVGTLPFGQNIPYVALFYN